MNFHRYSTICDASKNFPREFAHASHEELAETGREIALKTGITHFWSQTKVECEWHNQKRPYYNVWPAIQDALARTTLDLPADCYNLPMKTVSLRFAEGHEPGGVIRCALVSKVTELRPPNREGLALFTDAGEKQHGFFPVYIYAIWPHRVDMTIEEALEKFGVNHSAELNEDEIKLSQLVIRTVVGLCLMADDPDLVVPDVLNKDRRKFEDTGDQKFIDRAHRRGKKGWNVGAELEVSPHYRRAHFGIRWMGHGTDKKPVLRPVKGAIVKRAKLTEVPTGFED